MITSVDQDIKQLELPYIANGNVKRYSHCGKIVWKSLIKLNTYISSDLTISKGEWKMNCGLAIKGILFSPNEKQTTDTNSSMGGS